MGTKTGELMGGAATQATAAAGDDDGLSFEKARSKDRAVTLTTRDC